MQVDILFMLMLGSQKLFSGTTLFGKYCYIAKDVIDVCLNANHLHCK